MFVKPLNQEHMGMFYEWQSLQILYFSTFRGTLIQIER